MPFFGGGDFESTTIYPTSCIRCNIKPSHSALFSELKQYRLGIRSKPILVFRMENKSHGPRASSQPRGSLHGNHCGKPPSPAMFETMAIWGLILPPLVAVHTLFVAPVFNYGSEIVKVWEITQDVVPRRLCPHF